MRGQEPPLQDSVGALRSPDTEIRKKVTVSGINLQIYCEVQVPGTRWQRVLYQMSISLHMGQEELQLSAARSYASHQSSCSFHN